MLQLSCFLCGVNDAGTSFVIRRVEAPRATALRSVWRPEWFLSDFDRKGPHSASEYVGETLMRMLEVEYCAVFAATLLTPPQAPIDLNAKDDSAVGALAPFDWSGAWRAMGEIVLRALAALHPAAFAPLATCRRHDAPGRRPACVSLVRQLLKNLP